MSTITFASRTNLKQEARRNARIAENAPVVWHVKDQGSEGTGRLRNISASGMLIEAKADVPFAENSILSFEAAIPGRAGFIPSLGRAVWSKKRSFSSGCLLGVEFIEPAQEVIAQLQEKVQSRIARIQNSEKIRNTVGGILFVAMVLLTGAYLVQQALVYRNIEEANRMLSAVSAKQGELYSSLLDKYNVQKIALNEVSQELDSTKTLLAQTQSMLSETSAQFESLRAEHAAMAAEYNVIKEKLRLLEGDIASLDEGKEALGMHKKTLRAVKVSIHNLKRKALEMRIAAQKERDRVALETGNQGFFLKDAKLFNPYWGQSDAQAVQGSPEKKIKINVSIVE